MAPLVRQIASETDKSVQVQVRMGSQTDLPAELSTLVREMAVQLTRNAVVHGIETPAQRLTSGKAERGTIDVQLVRSESDWSLVVRDDGAGLSAQKVRERLLALGWYAPSQLETFNDRQILAHIFKPGFSTASNVTLHAGRGVGLDVVQANAQKLGARVTLNSTPGQFCEFRIRFAA